MNQTSKLPSGIDEILAQVDQEIKAILPELLKNFLQDARAMLEALRQGDYETIHTMGHGMKGVGGFGLDHISELGRSLEQAAQFKDFARVQKLIDEVIAYVEGVAAIDS